MTDITQTPDLSRPIGRGRLDAIVTELRRQEAKRNDFVVDSGDLRIVPVANGDSKVPVPYLVPRASAWDFLPQAGVPLKRQALVQIAEKAMTGGVPTKFLDRAWTEHPEMIADFLTGVMQENRKRRLVRVLEDRDGVDRCRAFLGQNFKAIDNLDIAVNALERAQEFGAFPVEASLSDSHFRLRLVSAEIGEVLNRTDTSTGGHRFYEPGQLASVASGAGDAWRNNGAAQGRDESGLDTIHPIVALRNSETGHGGCDGDIGELLRVCFNMCMTERLVHQVHVGEKLQEGVFTRATYEKHAALVYSQIGDVVSAGFDPAKFAKRIDAVRGAQEHLVRAPTVAANVLISSNSGLRDLDLDALVSTFVAQPGRPTIYNLGQAAARLAQDRTPDDAESLEWLAGRVCSGKLTAEIETATFTHERKLELAR